MKKFFFVFFLKFPSLFDFQSTHLTTSKYLLCAASIIIWRHSEWQTNRGFFLLIPSPYHCYSKAVAFVERIRGGATSRAWSTQSNSIIALIFNLTLAETRPQWNCLAPLWSACLCAELQQKGFYQKQASFKAGKRRCIFHTQLYYLFLSISAATSLV